MAAPNPVPAPSGPAQPTPPVQPPAAPPWRRVPSVKIAADGRNTELYPEWADVLHPSFTDSKYYAPAPGHRPALMPNDAGRNPTREALRFGIHPALNDPFRGRSMMTPIDGHGPDAVRTGQMDNLEEDYQSTVHLDFTMSELLFNGAYAPEAPDAIFSSTSFQQHILSPLLSRNKWLDSPQGADPENPVLKYGLDPSVEFNVHRSDQVWDAIRPALAVATRILETHPFFATITNPYCLRPVPRNADSRTDAQFLADHSVPRVAIWPLDSQTANGATQMFPAARAIFQSHSPPLLLQPIIERFLGELLTFKFVGRPEPVAGEDESNYKAAGTQPVNIAAQPGQIPGQILIQIGVDTVWPLLHPDLSAGEKALWTLRLASTVLHELAHAARLSIYYATLLPDFLRTGPPGTGATMAPSLDAATQQHFSDLGQQIGVFRVVKNAVMVAPSWDNGWFYEDEQQAEEGKSFEKLVFGATLEPLGSGGGSKNAFLAPGPIALDSFPWALPNPRPSEWNGRNSCGSYTLYLADPPPPFFIITIPLQVEKASRLFREEFWESDVVKFGCQSLKMGADETTMMAMAFVLSPQRDQIQQTFADPNTHRRISNEIAALRRSGKEVTASYLQERLLQNMQRPMFEEHMKLWRQQWPRTNTKVEDAQATAERAFRVLIHYARTITAGPDPNIRNNDRLQPVLAFATRAGSNAFGAIREVLRLVTCELQIHQHYLFEFNSNTEADRSKLLRDYSGPVSQRLQDTFRDIVLAPTFALCNALVLAVRGARLSSSPGQTNYQDWLESLNEELNRLMTLINTLQCLLDSIVRGVVAHGPLPEPMGLQLDIVKAIPKFQRRARDKRRNNLAAQEAGSLDKNGADWNSVQTCMALLATVKS